MIDTVVAQAQQLDDHQGGTARDFVADQFNAVARLLRRASYNAAAGRRLAAALAQLAQTAGFMAFDAHEDGLAQRWYLTALRAAHAASDPGLAASVLALMSNQATDRGHALDALELAATAQESAANTPPAVRSLVAARSSLAHAVAGDLDLAVDTARLALSRLPAVNSVRSVALLHRLHDDLVPAGARSPEVRDLRTLPEPPGPPRR